MTERPPPDRIPTRAEIDAMEAEVASIYARVDRGEPIARQDAARLQFYGYKLGQYVGYLEQAARHLERLRRGKRAKAAAGAYLGGPQPFGFRWDADAGEWATHDAEHPVLVEMLRLHDAGESYSGIADALNRRGVPTAKGGARWHASSVRRILLNPFYARLRAD